MSFDTCTNVVDVYVNYSTAQVDKKKVNRLATAIQVAFQQLGAYPTADLSGVVSIDETVDVRKAVPVVALPHKDENGDLIGLRKELEQALASEIARGEVEVRSGRDGLVISLREAGFFDSGSAGVKVGSQQAFSRRATLLGERQYNIRIEGHTDNVRIHNYAIYLAQGSFPCMVVKDSPYLSFRHENVHAHWPASGAEGEGNH